MTPFFFLKFATVLLCCIFVAVSSTTITKLKPERKQRFKDGVEKTEFDVLLTLNDKTKEGRGGNLQTFERQDSVLLRWEKLHFIHTLADCKTLLAAKDSKE